MKTYDITKLPFTSISRENWEMLIELDKDSLYDVIQKIGNYVLTGEKCDCDNTLSKIVCNQVISVIDRKGQAYFKTVGNLSPREKKQQPAPEPEKVVYQEPQPDDDTLFENFLSDPTMDYSTLLGNIDYFKERKKAELNKLYMALGKRYTGEQILQTLQDKWLERINEG